jgi:hypothetical protein
MRNANGAMHREELERSVASGRQVASREGFDRITAIYNVAATAGDIEAKARNLAVEQSVEMPLDAIGDIRIREEIAGQVAGIEPAGAGRYRV